jgi:hypothetical protein
MLSEHEYKVSEYIEEREASGLFSLHVPKLTNFRGQGLLKKHTDSESGAEEEQLLCIPTSFPAKCSSALRNALSRLRLQTHTILGCENTPQCVDQDFYWSFEAFEARKQYYIAQRCVVREGSPSVIVEDYSVATQDRITLDSLSKELLLLFKLLRKLIVCSS